MAAGVVMMAFTAFLSRKCMTTMPHGRSVFRTLRPVVCMHRQVACRGEET